MTKFRRPAVRETPSALTDKSPKKLLAPKKTEKPAKLPSTREDKGVRLADVRRWALTEFVTDPECRNIAWHYSKPGAEYQKLVGPTVFALWAQEDGWVERRKKYWEEVQQKVLAMFQERVAVQRMQDIGRFEMATLSLSEYMLPKRDAKGEVIRWPLGHEYEGLPVFPLAMPRFDKLVKSVIDLQEKLMLLRGEATSRSDTMSANGEEAKSLDPIAAKVKLTQEELRAMSRMLMLRRQPELQDDAIDVGDAESESDEEQKDGE